MPITRAEIVAAARSFLKISFAHQGRSKSVGLDCVGLPLCVGEMLGLQDKIGTRFLATDHLNYPAQPMSAYVHEVCQQRLIQKSLSEMKLGDVITLLNPSQPCHVAIVSEMHGVPHMIHADGKQVVENIIDLKWRRRIAGVFEFPRISD